MYRFFRKYDLFDTAIADAIESFFETPPELATSRFSLSDFADIIHVFPLVHTLMASDFFMHVTLLFRLLRRYLHLHLVNPVTEQMANRVPLSDEEQDDPRLREQIWFLQFLGASAHGITGTLNAFRDSRTSKLGASIRKEGNKIFNNSRTKTPNLIKKRDY